MHEELFDIVDSNNKPLLIQKPKTEAWLAGLWHRTAHIWLYTPTAEVLLQLRAAQKKIFPGKWHCSAAGHVIAGESPHEAAVRELSEELGLTVTTSQLTVWTVKKLTEIHGPYTCNEFCYIYLLPYSGTREAFKHQESEIEKIAFIPLEHIRKDYTEHPEAYVSLGPYWYEVLTEIQTRTAS